MSLKLLDIGSLSFKNGGLNLQEVIFIGQNEQEVLKPCKLEIQDSCYPNCLCLCHFCFSKVRNYGFILRIPSTWQEIICRKM